MAAQQTRQVGSGSQPRTAVPIGVQPGGRRETEKWPQSGLKNMNEERLSQALGWFSIGLGLAEIAAPRRLAQLIGVSDGGDTRVVLRTMGLREIASGLGILAGRRPAGSMWSRVGGDVMDLALLSSVLTSPNAKRGRVATATAAVLGVTALDVLCAQQLSRSPGAATESGTIRVQKSITINCSPEELYRFWRDFENLPRFMNHLESVRVSGEKRSHWVAKAPAGTTVEWDAEIIEDRPNELIAWRSLEGADVDNSGSVRFERAPSGRGTVVRVEMQYRPPGGVIGATIAKLFGEEPEQQLQGDLRRFKQLMETGEIIQSEATLQGTGIAQRPARPPASEAGR